MMVVKEYQHLEIDFLGLFQGNEKKKVNNRGVDFIQNAPAVNETAIRTACVTRPDAVFVFDTQHENREKKTQISFL